MTQYVSDEELQTAYHKIALVVARYGEKYLPIFERLEKEIEERKLKSDAMKRALRVAELYSLNVKE